jgi:hypothetical protein
MIPPDPPEFLQDHGLQILIPFQAGETEQPNIPTDDIKPHEEIKPPLTVAIGGEIAHKHNGAHNEPSELKEGIENQIGGIPQGQRIAPPLEHINEHWEHHHNQLGQSFHEKPLAQVEFDVRVHYGLVAA